MKGKKVIIRMSCDSSIKHRGRIDRALCIACGACSAVCPSEALIIEGMFLRSFPERCRPCGQAALVCPTGALKCPDFQ